MEASKIRDILRQNVATVEFKKKDGTIRKMICTLLPEFMPEAPAPDTKPSDTVITVFDLEKNDWRAFRVDSVMSIDTDDNLYVIMPTCEL